MTLEVDGDLGDLPRNTDLAAFRIIQESLTNVARHAGVPDAVVRIRAETARSALEILDEGIGRGRPRPSSRPAATGSPGCRSGRRPSAAGSTAGPRPGRGFAVRAELPLEPAS